MQGKEGRRDMGDEVDRKEKVRPLTLLRLDAEVGRSKLTPHPFSPIYLAYPTSDMGGGGGGDISLRRSSSVVQKRSHQNRRRSGGYGRTDRREVIEIPPSKETTEEVPVYLQCQISTRVRPLDTSRDCGKLEGKLVEKK